MAYTIIVFFTHTLNYTLIASLCHDLLLSTVLDTRPNVSIISSFQILRDLLFSARLLEADTADNEFGLLRQAYPGLDLVKESNFFV